MSPKKALENQQNLLFDSIEEDDDDEDGDQNNEGAGGLPEFYTVSEITEHMQALLEEDEITGSALTVRGELSNVKRSSRGHIYYTLKDGKASLNGVIWASLVSKLKFDLEDGLDIFVTGQIEIYAPNGTYSIVTSKMEPVGVGALQLAFQQIREKLEKEGLFDPKHKKALPEFPRRIGIVTSRTGAVIHDMLRVIRRKNSLVDVLLYPVAVQGAGAALEIADAVKELNHPEYNLDLLIVGRGGGSLEDLFCFSEEPAVRAIFESKLPVITGIGHEPDYSLSDAASDYSASTPTAAAEKAVPDIEQMVKDLSRHYHDLVTGIVQNLLYYEQLLDQSATTMIDTHKRTLENMETRIEQYRERLISESSKTLEMTDQTIKRLASELDAFSPLKTLSRGYAIATQPNGKVVQSIAQVKPGDEIELNVSDGKIISTIKETRKKS